MAEIKRSTTSTYEFNRFNQPDLTCFVFQNAKDTLKSCLELQINATVFQDELEEAKKTGSMDEVFGKYCAKTPAIKDCAKNFTGYLRDCLDPNERGTLNVTLEVLKRLGEFLCYNDGDRLASMYIFTYFQ